MRKASKGRQATPTWGTAKSLGATEGSVLTYYGHDHGPREHGVKVKVSRPEGRLALLDAKTGEPVLSGGAAVKFWARRTGASTPVQGSEKAVKALAHEVARTGKPKPPGLVWLALMREAGLSQTETARRMGVAPVTLNRLVRGRGIPTARITVRFANAVGVDVREVWGQVCDYELAQAMAEGARRGRRS